MAKETIADETKTMKNIYQRIHAVMKEVDYVQKTKPKDGGMKYSSVSHDTVTAAIRPHLVDQGVIYFPQNLVYKQDGNRTEVTLDIHFICADNPEDKLVVPSFGFGIDNQDKGPGKAVSYAIKYALLKTFGLETGDDPENDNIEHKKQEAKPQAVFKSNEERMDWIHKAGIEVKSLRSPEDIKTWEGQNESRIQALGEKQKEWLEDLIAKQRLTKVQAPLNGGSHAHA